MKISTSSRDFLITAFFAGRSTSLPLLNVAPAHTSGTRWCVDGPPAALGGLDELEGHRDAGCPPAGSLSLGLSCWWVTRWRG